MTATESHSQNDEWFLQRLLPALTASPGWPEGGRFCSEVWVRLSGAVSASLIRPLDPATLHVMTCKGVAGQIPASSESVLQESFASLLSSEAVQQLAPLQDPAGERHVLLWHDLLAALVLEFPPGFGRSGLSPETARVVLEPLCRRLLAGSSDAPVLYSDPDQLSAMAEFAAGAGHEINNPLGSILGQTQLLLRQESSIDKRQALETIGAQAWRIRDMIGDAMLFARPPAPIFRSLDLVSAVREAVEQSAAGHAGAQVTMEFRTSESALLAECDGTQWKTLLSHLLKNAAEAVRTTGQPGTVTATLRLSRRRHAAELVVRDTGAGISDAAVRRHMFDPFFSGRQAGRGLGFGLSLCAQIVRTHHGLLLFHSTAENDHAFHAAIPLQRPETLRRRTIGEIVSIDPTFTP